MNRTHQINEFSGAIHGFTEKLRGESGEEIHKHVINPRFGTQSAGPAAILGASVRCHLAVRIVGTAMALEIP